MEVLDYNFFRYIPFDYTKYPNFNKLPLRNDDMGEAPLLGMPEFIEDILLGTSIKDSGKEKFLRMFGIRYLSDPIFRRLSKDSVFLFIEGYYMGVFNSSSEASREGQRIKSRHNKLISIFIIPLQPDIIGYEKREVCNISTSEIIVDDNISYRSSATYEFDISFGIFENDIMYETKSEEFLYDTDANFTHVIAENYINSGTYFYSNYPFNENDIPAANIDNERNDLIEINKNIIDYRKKTVILGQNIISSRVQIFYKDGTFLIIGNKLKIPILSGLCTYFKQYKNTSIKIQNMIQTVVRASSPPKIDDNLPPITSSFRAHDRGIPSQRILGMDIISKLNSNTQIIHPSISILSLSLPSDSLRPDLNLDDLIPFKLENNYTILRFKQGMPIYIRSDVALPIDYYVSSYYLFEKNLLTEDNGIYQVFVTNRDIDLLVIRLIDGFKFKDIINENRFLDGYISYTENGYELWIRDIPSVSNGEIAELITPDRSVRSNFIQNALQFRFYNSDSFDVKYEDGEFKFVEE